MQRASGSPSSRRIAAALGVAGLLGVAALVASAVPAAAQGLAPGIHNPSASTPVDLYFHLVGFQQFPINTQQPDPAYSNNVEIGALGGTSTCLPTTPLSGASFHTFNGFSSPGYVEYDFLENGGPRYHPERGLSYDIQMDPSTPPTLTWFVSTAMPPVDGVPDDGSVPVIVPNLVVEATIRSGEDISFGPESSDVGELLLSGASQPATLARDQTSGASYTVVDGRDVYEISVPLTYAGAPVIAKASGYKLEVRMRLDVPGCDASAGGLMPNVVRIHTSPDHRPRMRVNVLDPIRIEYLHPQFVGGELYLHAAANSPFGNYDVDEGQGGIALTVTGPSEAPSMRLATLTQRTHVHDQHTEAVDLAYQWPFGKDAAKPGTYRVTLSVQNDQRTATALAVGEFTLGQDLTVTRCGRLDTTDGAETDTGCEIEHQDAEGNVVLPSKSSPMPAGALAAAAALSLARWRRKQADIGNG